MQLLRSRLLAASLLILAIFPNRSAAQETGIEIDFKSQIAPSIQKYCVGCHNEKTRESGIRVDHLDETLPDESLRLWEAVEHQIESGKMPPEDEPQPSQQERTILLKWIGQALHSARSRPTPRNGSMRRLTVSQYDRTIKALLGIDRNLADILPPDAISKDGFTNQANMLVMNPLQLENYLQIAEQAIDCAIVDPATTPVIQFFRMDLGRSIHPSPSKESLVLGANNHLLANKDFIVTEPDLDKSFPFSQFRMQRNFRFIEGYQGNDTVRGWRDFEGIEHAVFACMRGTEGYPKGKAYELFPSGLALRTAIPSPEIFGESSTYGPQANFKISLRELPERGRFQVRVTASKVADLLVVDSSVPEWHPNQNAAARINLPPNPNPINSYSAVIPEDGVYLLQVHLLKPRLERVQADSTYLESGLLGYWSMNRKDSQTNDNPIPLSAKGQGNDELVGNAKWVDSPFEQALSVSGEPSALVQNPDPVLSVGNGDFTVSAWIHPTKLAQGGIVCLGGYGYTHGWLLDMPNQNGILRIETANADRQHNGTVQSPPGTLRKDTWQHVCAVVRRGEQKTELFVNGYRVASGTIQAADLSNPKSRLHIGRIENAQGFHGMIDEVRLYQRALGENEIQALLAPGAAFVKPPEFAENIQPLELSLSKPTPAGNRHLQLTADLTQPSFCLTRLEKGTWQIGANYSGSVPIERIEFHRVDLDASQTLDAFLQFESRNPKLGVHLGLRRDCGSTLTQVGKPQVVAGEHPEVYTFEGDIGNYPAPEVEPDNVNYLAGIREIGIRHEYTDGRETPRLLIHRVEFEGPFYDTWPPASHRMIFPERMDDETDRDYAIRTIEQFATRAFRRPISALELKELQQVFDTEVQSGHDFVQSICEVLQLVLTSPQFLFLTETSQGPQPELLDDWELASKLSYFLWNGPPDERLVSLARTGQLRSQLDTQIDRMLGDPRSEAFAERFVSEWLSLDKFDVVEIDAKGFSHLTRDARKQLRREPIEFFRYLIAKDAPARDLIDSDYLVANEVVASYYGLGGSTESGFEFVPIKHGSPHLGGLLTQAAPLIGLSDGREGNPIKRGAWFARKIIAEPPDDPPPNVPKLEDLTRLSLREKLERHRDVRGCAQCHAGIDPWGLPFEQFDASGRIRSDIVDSKTTLGNGRELADFGAFRAYLAQERLDQVAFSLAKHLAIYASGRQLTYNEMQWLRENLGQLSPSGYRVKEMVRWIIHSDLFDKK
ncbi:MAG: DUF1592 domain-containing protein [Pirellula sp.]